MSELLADRKALLDGKVAIVTGAGQGVGMGAAWALAEAGALVVVTNRTVSKAERVAEAINSAGHRADALECDVRQPKHVESVVATTLNRHRGIDIVVNAADDQRLVTFMEISEEDMLAGYETGVLGALRFMHASVPHMEERGGGTFVNICSGAGPLATAGLGPYAATKEALRTLSRVAAVELGPRGIRVNVVCPIAWAPSFEQWTKDEPAAFAELIESMPLRRIGDPVIDVGRAIVFLCGPDSGYVTGATLMVDGGATYLG